VPARGAALAHRNAEAKGDASEDVWLELLATTCRTVTASQRHHHRRGRPREPTTSISSSYDPAVHAACVQSERNDLHPRRERLCGARGKAGPHAGEHNLRGKEGSERPAFTAHRRRIVDARGEVKDRKPPFDIAAGLVTYESSWADPFGTPLTNALAALAKSQWLNFGIAADSGYFEVKYVKGAKPAVNTSRKRALWPRSLCASLLTCRPSGPFTAMDYKEYSKNPRLGGQQLRACPSG